MRTQQQLLLDLVQQSQSMVESHQSLVERVFAIVDTHLEADAPAKVQPKAAPVEAKHVGRDASDRCSDCGLFVTAQGVCVKCSNEAEVVVPPKAENKPKAKAAPAEQSDTDIVLRLRRIIGAAEAHPAPAISVTPSVKPEAKPKRVTKKAAAKQATAKQGKVTFQVKVTESGRVMAASRQNSSDFGLLLDLVVGGHHPRSYEVLIAAVIAFNDKAREAKTPRIIVEPLYADGTVVDHATAKALAKR